MITLLKEPALAAPLFEGWEETLITSALTGTMGSVYADDEEPTPSSAMCLLGDFAFYAGRPSEKLLLFSPDGKPRFCILTPQNESWEALIEQVYGNDCHRETRYAFHRSEARFDRGQLSGLSAALPDGYSLQPMNTPQGYRRCMEHGWSRDFVSQFRDEADYLARGLGIAVVQGEELVGGASSYSVFPGGIEIEIDVEENHRRQGLATVCAASLILEALRRGLYPSWDAANETSARLARRLGYGPAHEYTVFFTNHMGFSQRESKI